METVSEKLFPNRFLQEIHLTIPAMMNEQTTRVMETGQSDVPWMTLSQAAKGLPKVNGKRIHVSTLWRWCRKGQGGITLEYARMGRRVVVTPEALNRFFAALAQPDKEHCRSSVSLPTRRKQRPRTDAARQRALHEADAVLRKAKILV